ncbi:hypothetical protein RB213_011011, partial [Colletotrichum asianum]
MGSKSIARRLCHRHQDQTNGKACIADASCAICDAEASARDEARSFGIDPATHNGRHRRHVFGKLFHWQTLGSRCCPGQGDGSLFSALLYVA